MKKKGKYISGGNIESRKLSIDFYEDFDDDFNDISNSSENEQNKTTLDDGELWKVTETRSCPLELDNPNIIKEISQPIAKSAFNYNLSANISLVPKPSLHKHDIWEDVNATENSEDNYFDAGSLDCNIPYKIKYEIEITEITKTLLETDNLTKVQKLIEDFPEQRERIRLENSRRNFKELNDYIEKHLETELKRAINRLTTEYFTLHETKNERQENIKFLINDEEKELRKRLEIRKGRIPSINQNISDEKETFLRQCFEAFEQIQKKRKKLNQTELVKILFERESNPHQTLRRKLKLFDLSFQDLLSKYSEQKSS